MLNTEFNYFFTDFVNNAVKETAELKIPFEPKLNVNYEWLFSELITQMKFKEAKHFIRADKVYMLQLEETLNSRLHLWAFIDGEVQYKIKEILDELNDFNINLVNN